MTDPLSETGSERSAANHREPCTNCGGTVEARYCTACGQKAVSLDRPALTLAREALDGFFSLDGKFWRTLIGVYRRPGQAARAYLDGRRAHHTPPVRLYVIAALVFVLGFQASGIALIGVVTIRGGDTLISAASDQTIASISDGPIKLGIRPFRPPWAPDPEPIDWSSVRAELQNQAERDQDGVPVIDIPTEQDLLDAGGMAAMLAIVSRDPLGAEQRANLALNQAVLVMVVLFALFNAVLHPSARLITHAVHSLYFHAALLPLTVFSSVVATYVSAVSSYASIPFGVGGLIAALYLAYRSDRTVYASSWYGAALRMLPLALLYLLSFLCLAIALVLL